MSRITPAHPPFPPDIQNRLDEVMQGREPLTLFTVLARDERLFHRFMDGSLLDRGHLTLRQREIVIGRTTALCGSSYEWGVHLALFGDAAGLGVDEREALALKDPCADCWTPPERCLLRTCDELHRASTINKDIWSDLKLYFVDQAIIEIIMLIGFYHTVSFLTNGLAIEDESFGIPLPSVRLS